MVDYPRKGLPVSGRQLRQGFQRRYIRRFQAIQERHCGDTPGRRWFIQGGHPLQGGQCRR